MSSSLSSLHGEAFDVLVRELLVQIPPETVFSSSWSDLHRSRVVENETSASTPHSREAYYTYPSASSSPTTRPNHEAPNGLQHYLHRLIALQSVELYPGAPVSRAGHEMTRLTPSQTSEEEIVKEIQHEAERTAKEASELESLWCQLILIEPIESSSVSWDTRFATLLKMTFDVLQSWSTSLSRVQRLLEWYKAQGSCDPSNAELVQRLVPDLDNTLLRYAQEIQSSVSFFLSPLVERVASSNAFELRQTSTEPQLTSADGGLVWAYLVVVPPAITLLHQSIHFGAPARTEPFTVHTFPRAQSHTAEYLGFTSPMETRPAPEMWRVLPMNSLLDLAWEAYDAKNSSPPCLRSVSKLLRPLWKGCVEPLERVLEFHFSSQREDHDEEKLGPSFFFDVWLQECKRLHHLRECVVEERLLRFMSSPAASPTGLYPALAFLSLTSFYTGDFLATRSASGTGGNEPARGARRAAELLRGWWWPLIRSIGERRLAYRAVRLFHHYYHWESVVKQALEEEKRLPTASASPTGEDLARRPKGRSHQLLLLSINSAFEFMSAMQSLQEDIGENIDPTVIELLLYGLFASPSDALRVWCEHLRRMAIQPFHISNSRLTPLTELVRSLPQTRRALLLPHTTADICPAEYAGQRNAQTVEPPLPMAFSYSLRDPHRRHGVAEEDHCLRRLMVYPVLEFLQVTDSMILHPLAAMSPLLRREPLSREVKAVEMSSMDWWSQLLWDAVVEPVSLQFLRQMQNWLGKNQSSCTSTRFLVATRTSETTHPLPGSATEAPFRKTGVIEERSKHCEGPDECPYNHCHLLRLLLSDAAEAQQVACSCHFRYQLAVYWRAARILWVELESLQILSEGLQDLRVQLGDSDSVMEAAIRSCGTPAFGTTDSLLRKLSSRGEETRSRTRCSVRTCLQYLQTQDELFRICRQGMQECFQSPVQDGAEEPPTTEEAESYFLFPSLLTQEGSAWHALEEFLELGRCTSLSSPCQANSSSAPVVLPALWSEVERTLQLEAAEAMQRSWPTSASSMVQDFMEYLTRMGCPNAASLLLGIAES